MASYLTEVDQGRDSDSPDQNIHEHHLESNFVGSAKKGQVQAIVFSKQAGALKFQSNTPNNSHTVKNESKDKRDSTSYFDQKEPEENLRTPLSIVCEELLKLTNKTKIPSDILDILKANIEPTFNVHQKGPKGKSPMEIVQDLRSEVRFYLLAEFRQNFKSTPIQCIKV